ncbi:hypothetical protein NP233_g4185 [Leucocoprinus birnbaumii]|uniref:NAD(P)-binding domain-containing protein n=1 Tax=Leucocoprinus birnbaumii TaxID=56174 RepID=A0AAD5VWK3_9AGAR|nr:hypothetical protein NP233_g4185 [Leucocoprinus birnbaumii]
MSSANNLNVLVLGGSRHIGYHAALRLLGTGATVTFLLRNPSCFDSDTEIQKYVSSKNVNLVKGDATVRSDVQNVWDVATAGGESPVHVVLCTIGFSGSPSFNILKGVQISPPNLLTLSLLNLFSTMPPSTSSDTTSPKFVIISATGVNQKSRAAAPILLRPLYSYAIQGPLQDKHGAERVVSVLGGWNWDSDIPEPEDQILDRAGKWLETEGMPKAGTLKNVVVVRPALLDDGECRADKVTGKAPYRVGEGEVGGWSVSRKDVAHFVVEMVRSEAKWDAYKDRQISIAY